MAIVKRRDGHHSGNGGGVILPRGRGLLLALLVVNLSWACRAAVSSEAHCPRGQPCARQMAAFESGKAWEGFKVVSKFIGKKAGVQGLLAGMLLSAVVGVRLAPAGTFSLYHTVGEIPASAFAERTVLAAQVIKVSDGDTMRARHTPTFSLGRDMGSGRLSDETLIVRLAGVDAPEVAKRGEPGQPFSEEAKEYVKKRVLNQKVRVKLLRKDQYARAVARVEYGTWPLRHDLSEDLLREGLAVVYRQGGAEYDGRLQRFEQLEAEAKKARKGLWSAGKRLETPAQFKAKKRAAERLQQGQGQQQKEPVYAAPRFRTQ